MYSWLIFFINLELFLQTNRMLAEKTKELRQLKVELESERTEKHYSTMELQTLKTEK